MLFASAGNPPPTFSYLVVAGGGARGGTGGGSAIGSIAGGGAGGFLESTLTNSYSTYTVTVGAGGISVGQSGSNSALISGGTTLVEAIGGGHGATLDGGDGAAGGSGGGGFGYGDGVFGARGGAGVSGQGYNGGNGYRVCCYTAYGGGGGGAGGSGANNTPTGGARKNSTILTASNSSYTSGFAGGGQTYTTQPGDQSRSGIVAIKYPVQYSQAVVTGNPTEIIDGSDRIYVWTGSGSFSF